MDGRAGMDEQESNQHLQDRCMVYDRPLCDSYSCCDRNNLRSGVCEQGERERPSSW